MIAHAQRGFASVGTVRANCRYVLHLPRPRFVAIRPARECAHRADIDTHPALFALEVIAAVRDDYAVRAAHAHAERFHVHAFVANAHAAEAQNASRGIVIHQLRPLFFRAVNFFFHEAAGVRAVAKHHVLQLALAAFVADRAVERVIGQQELQHVLARLANLLGIRSNNHTVGRHHRARGLQFRRLLNFHQAHPARGLQGQPRVIAERRNFRSEPPRRFNDQRALRHLHFAVVNLQLDEFLVWHGFLSRALTFTLHQPARQRICKRNVPSNDPQTLRAISS